jgi:integrase
MSPGSILLLPIRFPKRTGDSVKLNQRNVAGLKLPDGKTDKIYFDDDLKGFGLRLRSDGGGLRRIWIAQYRVKGTARTRRSRIGDAETLNADQARAKAKTELAKVALGHDPQGEKAAQRLNAAHTLRSVADDYLAMKKLEVERGEYRASSYRVTNLYLTGKAYFGPLHSTSITEIALPEIATRLNAITRNSGTVTAGRARSALSSLFTWAMQNGLMGKDPRNPVIATKKPNDATPRDRVLSDAELAAIWRACKDDDFGKIVKLLALTGCRRDEIGGLRWPEIDLEKGLLNLPGERVKNGHAHTLPLTPLALAIVGSVHQRIDRDHLFGDRSGRGFTRWSEEKRRLDDRLGAKVAPFRLHDIRRSVATGMADLDVEPHHIEAVLNHYSGHRSGDAGTYNRAKYARQMATALAVWADHLRSLIDGGERKVLPFPQAAQETA